MEVSEGDIFAEHIRQAYLTGGLCPVGICDGQDKRMRGDLVMRFFIDTAKVEDIRKANDMGVICGVTTNPSLIAKEGRIFEEVDRKSVV